MVTKWVPGTLLACLAVLNTPRGAAAAEPALFESRQLAPSGEYTGGIEGPAVDAAGTLYVVNFRRQGTIGKLKSGATRSELFTSLAGGSIGNGIRFDREGRMYIADFRKHNVLVIEAGQSAPQVYFHSDRFNQPNDLASRKRRVRLKALPPGATTVRRHIFSKMPSNLRQPSGGMTE